MTTRVQWPRTIEEIEESLDGIWGLVGATSVNGNLWHLERSLHQPLIYTVTEYFGLDENKTVAKHSFPEENKGEAVYFFAQSIGF